MTLDKSVVATWTRTVGCSSDDERRSLAQALMRKASRFAFPDDFVKHVRNLRNRVQKKHAKQSPEGEAWQELIDIRVRASPSWDNNEISLFFWFICNEIHSGTLGSFVAKWLALVPPEGRFRESHGQLASFEDMTASDYLGSDSLDFGYLSGPYES
jgi:hypothetical protein